MLHEVNSQFWIWCVGYSLVVKSNANLDALFCSFLIKGSNLRTAHAPSRPVYCRIVELLFSNFSNRRAKRKWPFLCGMSCFFNLKYFRAGEAEGKKGGSQGEGSRQHSKLIYHNKRGGLLSWQVNTPGQVDDWPQSTHTERDREGEKEIDGEREQDAESSRPRLRLFV